MSSPINFDAEAFPEEQIKLLSGYIREHEQSCTIHVPEDIISMCMAFYCVPFDSFNLVGGCKYNVSEDDKTATADRDRKGSIYLSNVVHSGVHHWQFKIKQHAATNYSVRIGVWKDKHAMQIHKDMDVEGECYAFNLAYARLTQGDDGDGDRPSGSLAPAEQYSKHRTRRTRCKTGDTVDMVLDLNRLELRYSQNDRDYGVAFSVEKTAYRAGVFMFREGDSVELVSYTPLARTRV